MRCSEARLRITASRRDEVDPTADRELLEHLQDCPQCAREAGVAGTLKQMFEAGRKDDTINVVPMADQRTLVEARLARGETVPGRRLLGLLRRRPALGVGIVVTAAVLALFALVPFKYSQTIGYEIAFAGVNPGLVDDNDTLCDVLYDLGIDEAAVDVLDCDTTCRVIVFDLRTRHEADLVVTALERINDHNLSADVQPVQVSTTRTILDRANEKLLGGRS